MQQKIIYSQSILILFISIYFFKSCVNSEIHPKKYLVVGLEHLQFAKFKFYLYSNNLCEKSLQIKWDRILHHLPAIFIIHGYKSSCEADWVTEMAVELLKNKDCNVFAMDWKEDASNNYYYTSKNKATINMGLQLAKFIEYLQSNKVLEWNDVHIIGHSLGAHIAGIAGHYVFKRKNKLIGKITGLDPAGVGFTKTNAKDEMLDKTDAQFVYVIHTDANTFGTNKKIGHFDFYPNNGSSQPIPKDCPYIKRVSYSHSMATHLFIKSINECKFVAFKCINWMSYVKQKCSTTQTTMDSVNKKLQNIEEGSYFLETSANTPYCGYYYSITISMKSVKGDNMAASLHLKIFGEKEKILEVNNPAEVGFKEIDNDKYELRKFSELHLGEIQEIYFKWKVQRKKSAKVYLSSIDIHEIGSMDERETSIIHFTNSQEKEQNIWYQFLVETPV